MSRPRGRISVYCSVNVTPAARFERHDLPENVAGPVAGDAGWPLIVGRFVDRAEGREPTGA